MPKIQLTDVEIEALKEEHKTVRDKRSGDRIKAILMLNKGYSSLEIAELLLLDERTIRKWRVRYEKKKTLKSYIINNYSGYRGKLRKEERELVSKYVSETIISDSKQVRLFIESKFRVKYSRSAVIALLHQLGFNYKQTSIIPSGLDTKKQAEFKKNYEVFVSNLKMDETLVFMDGMHPVHNLETGRAWIKVGEKKHVRTNSGRSRCNLNGFYNPNTQDVWVKDYKTLNAESIIDSFKILETFYLNKATIYVIIDNARYYKNTKVQAWLKTSRIEPIYLPPYSPNLNLIERFWKVLKREMITNTFYLKFDEFRQALLDVSNKSSPDHKAALKKSVGSKLHLFHTA